MSDRHPPVPVIAHPSADGALSRVGPVPGTETVVLLGADAAIRIATMTSFGPNVHAFPKVGAAAAAKVLAGIAAPAVGPGKPSFLHAPADGVAGEVLEALAAGGVPSAAVPGDPVDDAAEALARFLARRPEVPVTGTADGGSRARGWCVAPFDGGVEISHGMSLSLRAEPEGGGIALRWRHPDTGVDMGIHALLPRTSLTPEETAVVDGARARVTAHAYGLGRVPGGEGERTVVLMLDIPRGLETGFRDGTRPVGGVA